MSRKQSSKTQYLVLLRWVYPIFVDTLYMYKQLLIFLHFYVRIIPIYYMTLIICFQRGSNVQKCVAGLTKGNNTLQDI